MVCEQDTSDPLITQTKTNRKRPKEKNNTEEEEEVAALEYKAKGYHRSRYKCFKGGKYYCLKSESISAYLTILFKVL